MILCPLYSYQYPLIFIQSPWASPRCPCPACQEPTFMIPTVVANATRKQTGSTLAQDQTWLVVWNIFFQILGIIIPTDFHIFQRGTVGQPPTRNCGSCWDGNVIDRNDRELATTICQRDLLPVSSTTKGFERLTSNPTSSSTPRWGPWMAQGSGDHWTSQNKHWDQMEACDQYFLIWFAGVRFDMFF